MNAELFIANIYDMAGLGLVLAGTIESGGIMEGLVSKTRDGKKFSVVKIEKEGAQVTRAGVKDKVHVYVKYLNRGDVRVGEIIYFT